MKTDSDTAAARPGPPSVPASCEAAVFDPATRQLAIETFQMPDPAPGEAIVRVSSSAVCGSDLHTFLGHRTPPGPLILGHESCGTIVRLGTDLRLDANGIPLRAGDRVTWSIAASCGSCFFCQREIPQKCESLFKYGHESTEARPQLNGGFAEYVYLAKGTAVYKLPDTLPDQSVVFANCAGATVAAAHRIAEVEEGDAVLVQGAGLLGLFAVSMAAAAGARCILVTDTVSQRLEMARRFGATHTLLVDGSQPSALLDATRKIAGPRGFDSAIEVCGYAPAVASALPALRIGARYILVGCVFPGAEVTLDLQSVTTRLISLIGLHNYAPKDLAAAIDFLDAHRGDFPFHEIVGRQFPLHEIASAFQFALDHRETLRVAIGPGPAAR